MDQTRRNWLVTIGQAAAATAITGELIKANELSTPLPPGVYLPSRDHLGHALMNSENFHSLPPGCPTDYLRPNTGPYTPLFFSSHDFGVVNKVIELLLGSDSGESGEIQGIAEWVDLRVWGDAATRKAWSRLNAMQRQLSNAYYGAEAARTLHTSKPELICQDGLSWLRDRATSDHHSEGFLSLTKEQQLNVLSSVSDEQPAARTESAGTRFFDYLKEETIRGFYTSKAGLKELDFKGNAYYAKSPGCDRTRA